MRINEPTELARPLLIATKALAVNLIAFVHEVYAVHHIDCSDDATKQIVNALRQIEKQFGQPIEIVELSEAMVLKHLAWLKRVRELAPDTIHRRRNHILGIWRLAYKKGMNPNDPARADIPKIRRPHLVPIAWSLSDLEKMLSQAENTSHAMFSPKCWKALLLLIYYTGLRIGAVLKLKRSDLKGHYLFVRYRTQKDVEEQQFRLPNELVNLLVSLPRPNIEKHGRNLTETLIPWPWSFHRVQKVLQNYILKPAGLPLDRKLKFHALRKTVATVVAAKQGKEIALKVMGHSSMSVLERYLADPATVDPSLAPNFAPMDVMPSLGESA